jgi:predicted metal-dependent HD superfamily phosphohydrolase
MNMLTNSLNNLTTAYFLKNRHEKLIPLLIETIALHRQLAVTTPEVHLPALAHALCKVADQRRRWKEHEEASRNMTEGIALYREFAHRSPEYLPQLAENVCRDSVPGLWKKEKMRKPLTQSARP